MDSTAIGLLCRLGEEVAALLREDPRRVVVGEDVADGGMLGLTRACRGDEALAARLLSLPLTPAATFAHAAGLAMAGRRPLVILPSASALLEGFAGLAELCQIAASAGGERSREVLIIAPTGPGFGLGGQAGASPEDLLATLPGLRVLCLGDACEAVALLRSAADFSEGGGEPTLLLLPRSLLLTEVVEESLVGSLGRPLGGARVLCEGEQATLYCWGACVARALEAAEASDFSVTVVDLIGLAPLDIDTLAATARTGKLVIAHPGERNAIAAEVAALLACRAILHLDAPILRVGGVQGPLVYSQESTTLPSVDALMRAIAEVVNY